MNQSGMSGLAPGPVLGHRRSASRNSGAAIFTNACKHVPAVARFPILGISGSYSFLVEKET